MRSWHYDDWTIESWRIEPRRHAFQVEMDETAQDPPLWKDLMLASVVAVGLWVVAVAMLI